MAPRKPALKRTPASAGNKTQDKGSAFTIRPKSVLMATPAGTLGFSVLITPDSKFVEPGKFPKFNLKLHLSEAAQERMAEKLQEMMDTLIPKLEAEITKKNGKIKLPLKRISGAAYLEEQLKLPAEASRIQLPFMSFSCNSEKPLKDGGTERITIKAYSKDDAPLDLPALKMGMGSIVQVLLEPGVFVSALTEDKTVKRRQGDPMVATAKPTLRLIGVRILKLEQYGPGAGKIEDLDDKDLAGLDADFEAEDLAAYAMGATSPSPAGRKALEAHELVGDDSIDDEIPF